MENGFLRKLGGDVFSLVYAAALGVVFSVLVYPAMYSRLL